MPYLDPSLFTRVALLNTLGPGMPRVAIRSLGRSVYITVAPGTDWTTRRLRAEVPELRGWYICRPKAYRKALTLAYPTEGTAKLAVYRIRMAIRARLEQVS